jgi:type I restriction enzyme, S subunit
LIKSSDTKLLGELCEVVRGVSYRKEDAREGLVTGHIPLLRAMNIATELRFDPIVSVPPKYVKPEQLLRVGDIVIAASSGSRNVVGKGAPLIEPWHGSFGAFCAVLRLRNYDLIDARYLAYFVRSAAYRQRISAQAAGVNINNIRREHLDLMPVPWPERDCRRAAVEELDRQLPRIDAGAAALARSSANLVRYKAAVIGAACAGQLTSATSADDTDEMRRQVLAGRRAEWTRSERRPYREPVSVANTEAAVPRGWTVMSLAELTSAVRPVSYGILMPKDDVPGGVLYARVVDFKSDRIETAAMKRTSTEIAAAYARSTLRTGDLLLSIRGTYGRVAHVPVELDGGNITQDTVRLDIHPALDRAWVAWQLRSPRVQGYFRRVARGVAVKGVNVADVRRTPILLPPPSEQGRLVTEIERRLSIGDALAIELRKGLQRAERLRASLLREIFGDPAIPGVRAERAS